MTKKQAAVNPFSDLDWHGFWDDWNDDEWWDAYEEADTDEIKQPELPLGFKEVPRGADSYQEDHAKQFQKETDFHYAEENPLGIAWEQYYLIMDVRNILQKEGYCFLLGKDEGRWCFRVYGLPYPEKEIHGVPIRNIPTVIPKVA